MSEDLRRRKVCQILMLSKNSTGSETASCNSQDTKNESEGKILLKTVLVTGTKNLSLYFLWKLVLPLIGHTEIFLRMSCLKHSSLLSLQCSQNKPFQTALSTFTVITCQCDSLKEFLFQQLLEMKEAYSYPQIKLM